ncbi:MAG TPA: glycosyltransferase family 4 protein, partial [Anaerolineales bacterium]
LALGLHQRGHSVDFFLYAPGDLLAGPLHAADIPIHTFLKRSRYSPDVIWALRDRIQAGKYDLVLSFLPTPNFYAISAIHSLAKKPRLVISERSYDPPEGVGLGQELLRQSYRLTDHLVVNSRHQRMNFARKYPWLTGRLSTIYNGFDLDLFTLPGNEPLNDPLKLIAIASVSPFKNGLCLVRALAILRSEYGLCPEVSWVGRRDHDRDRLAYLKMMEQEIADRHLGDEWHWLGQRTDIVPLLQQHDALVHPSYGEGLPNVVCEALACGRPVLVSNTLDHPYLVQDRVSGYLFDHRDPASLAQAIKEFHDLSASDRRAMGVNARQFAEQNLSLARFISDYEKLFASLLG